jgi:DNA-binding XRE family transcriptional regulator
MPDVFIYALCEPDTGAVRYVGLTNRPSTRLNQHIHDTTNQQKQEWLAGLQAKGLLPQKLILEQVSDADDWPSIEQRWIAFHREQGADLLNISRQRAVIQPTNRRKATRYTTRLPYLRDWRRFQHLTQLVLAEQANVSHQTIVRAELGLPVHDVNVQKLATALGLDASTLAHRAPAEEAERVPAHAG